mmetsp:Transcript_93351/g.269615  ORF Transcript_93351/g.269615 Transcript_93351/m.269615 type:complete len:426 (-) Transcript_93351:847-2124(-)
MRVDGVQDVDVGAVVELYLTRRLSVFLRQVAAEALVLALKFRVVDGTHREHLWAAAVEGRALQEGAHYLIALCALQRDILHRVGRALCGQGPMLTPTRIHIAKVPSPAVAGDASWTPLARRPVGVVNCDAPLPATLEEGLAIQSPHILLAQLRVQPNLRLCELSPHDADLRLGHLGRVPLEKAAHVTLQLLINEVGVQVAQPQGICARCAHGTWPVRRQLGLAAAAHGRVDPRAGRRQAHLHEPLPRHRVDHRCGEGAVRARHAGHGDQGARALPLHHKQGPGSGAPRLLGLRRELALPAEYHQDLAACELWGEALGAVRVLSIEEQLAAEVGEVAVPPGRRQRRDGGARAGERQVDEPLVSGGAEVHYRGGQLGPQRRLRLRLARKRHGCLELHQVDGQGLLRPRDHIVGAHGHPNVIAVEVRL